MSTTNSTQPTTETNSTTNDSSTDRKEELLSDAHVVDSEYHKKRLNGEYDIYIYTKSGGKYYMVAEPSYGMDGAVYCQKNLTFWLQCTETDREWSVAWGEVPPQIYDHFEAVLQDIEHKEFQNQYQ